MPGSSNGPSVFQDLPTVLSAICLTCLHVSTIPSCNPSTEKVKGLQFVCCSLCVHLILLKFFPVDRQEHQGWTKSQSRKGISLHVRVKTKNRHWMLVNLRSIRQHCIKNGDVCIKDITTWAQEDFRKT